MVILVVFNSFNVVKNLKKPNQVARQMPPLYTTDANNLYGAAMSEKLPINGFKWVYDISGINEKFVKGYDKKK